MYAVIKTGGKQYSVKVGDVVYVEKLNAEDNSEVTFDQVLAVGEEGSVKSVLPLLRRFRCCQGRQDRQGQEAQHPDLSSQEGQHGPQGSSSALHQGGNHRDQRLRR